MRREVVVGYTEEAPGVRSTMRLAVLAAVGTGCLAVLGGFLLMLVGKQGPIEELIITGGGMALSSQVMKALQKNIEKRIEFGREGNVGSAVHTTEPADGESATVG